MALEDASKEKGGSPELPNTPFQWGAVLSAVKDQIPSMDFDISMSDGDEDDELFIFQRDQTNLIPDLTEELEDLPPEESLLQNTFAFMGQPQEVRHGDPESPAVQEESTLLPESKGGVLLNMDSFGCQAEERSDQKASDSATKEELSGQGISGVVPEKFRKEKNTPNSSSDMLPEMEMSRLLMFNTGKKERRKLIETKILSKAPLGPPSRDLSYPQPHNNNNNNIERMAELKKEEAVVLAEKPQGLTLLGFKDIEKWDLDTVLQELKKQNNATDWSREADSPLARHETFMAVSQTRLMGKLEELAHKQAKVFSSRCQSCPTKLPHFDRCQGDGRDVPPLAPSANHWGQTLAELQRIPEPPTVYIDLRNTTSQKLEFLAEETESMSDSSSDDEEDTEEAARSKEEEGKMNRFLHPSRKNCTGKSFLLQQLRNFRKMMSQSLAIVPNNQRSQNLQNSSRTDLPNVRRQSLKLSGQTSVKAANWESNARCTQPIESNNGTAKPLGKLQKGPKKMTSSELAPDSSASKDIKHSRTVEIQQEKQVRENLMKQEELEKFKPQDST